MRNNSINSTNKIWNKSCRSRSTTLTIDTACRISALQSIKLENIDLENGIITGIVEKEQKIVEFAIFEETTDLK